MNMIDMAASFNSVRKFYFEQMIVEYDSKGRIPLRILRAFWRAATRQALTHRRDLAMAFKL